jgi:endothelin-converting enzyme/putative endopeptidase
MRPFRPAAGAALLLAVSACLGARPAPTPPGAGGIDAAALDRAVAPCDDFYRFACGGWIDRTEIPPDRSRWSRSFDEIQERNLAQLRALAEAAAAAKLGPEDRYADKVGAYYASCMDEAALEARGLEDLRAEWKQLDAVKDARSLSVAVARLHREGVWPVFRLVSDQDAKDATQVIGVVVQGGLTLPDREYYLKDDPKSAEIRKEYEAHVARMLALAGAADARARADARAIVALEGRLAEAHWTRVEMRDPARTYNRVELAGLRKAAPAFAWNAYLAELGHPDLAAFSATTPRFLGRVSELVAKTPPDTWRAYLRWRLLASATSARAMPRAFVDEGFRFNSRTFTGAKELTPRWKHCVQMADGALGEALGQAWVRRHFGGDAKAKAQRLVADVEGAMGRTLPRVEWMDEPTRALAQRKLQRIANKIGYPDAWRNYDALAVDRSSFLRTLAAGRAFEVDRDLDKIGEPLDRGEWFMSPPTVNAYYSPSLNEMAFPGGILQPPFYDPAAVEAANYGAIGMVVGHELTHGFDDQGRKFDAAGNLRDWWSPAIAREFDRRAQCVARQYGAYDAVEGSSDLKLNGELTLGENIADLGGVKLAFAAYQASRAGKAPEAPVEGFAPAQAFFVSYAQSWCSKIRPEAARLRAQTDPHSPARWRVNGPLSNLPEFAAAFACPAAAPMVRAERCEVW